MASRHAAAARPRRSGETFARTHDSTSTPRFDPRNPSALAPDARDEDDDANNEDLLAADVGRSATVKRGAVNIDGFDSDSDNDNINAQADARARRRQKKNKAVDYAEQMDKYDAGEGQIDGDGLNGDQDASDVDMFAPDKGDGDGGSDGDDNAKKTVRFLRADEIANQEIDSHDRTHISINLYGRDSDTGSDTDSDNDSNDDDDKEQPADGVDDDEVGAGGRKRNAPKIEAFNLRQEMDEGRFDQDGNYVRKAIDPDARHDDWLAGVSKRDIRKAAEAHEKRQAEATRQRLDEAAISVADLLGALIMRLQRAETPLEAMARLGRKRQPKTKAKRVPEWRRRKEQRLRDQEVGRRDGDVDGGDMDVDTARPSSEEDDPEQKRIKADIEAITDAADKLLARDFDTVYEQERELLQRAYRRETGHDWVEGDKDDVNDVTDVTDVTDVIDVTGDGEDDLSRPGGLLWEYRWTDGRGDGSRQGPFDGPTMKAWQDAGYFGEGVEFRQVGEGGGWTLLPSFV